MWKDIVIGVAHMHQCGVAHLDLKPQNILLPEGYLDGEEGAQHAKLCDFSHSYGAGPSEDAVKVPPTQVGAGRYMGPEVSSGEAYDGFTADVWSLGVILYTLLTGQLPFPPDPDSIRKDDWKRTAWFSPQLTALLDAIFAKDPSQRLKVDGVKASEWWSGQQALEDGSAQPVTPGRSASAHSFRAGKGETDGSESDALSYKSYGDEDDEEPTGAANLSPSPELSRLAVVREEAGSRGSALGDSIVSGRSRRHSNEDEEEFYTEGDHAAAVTLQAAIRGNAVRREKGSVSFEPAPIITQGYAVNHAAAIHLPDGGLNATLLGPISQSTVPDRHAQNARLPRKKGTHAYDLPALNVPGGVDVYTDSVLPTPSFPPQAPAASMPTAAYLNGKRQPIEGHLSIPAEPLGQPSQPGGSVKPNNEVIRSSAGGGVGLLGGKRAPAAPTLPSIDASTQQQQRLAWVEGGVDANGMPVGPPPQRLRTPASLARLERRQQLTTGVTNNYAFEPPPASADAEARAATIGRQDVPHQQGGPTFTGAGDFSGGFDQLQRLLKPGVGGGPPQGAPPMRIDPTVVQTTHPGGLYGDERYSSLSREAQLQQLSNVVGMAFRITDAVGGVGYGEAQGALPVQPSRKADAVDISDISGGGKGSPKGPPKLPSRQPPAAKQKKAPPAKPTGGLTAEEVEAATKIQAIRRGVAARQEADDLRVGGHNRIPQLGLERGVPKQSRVAPPGVLQPSRLQPPGAVRQAPPAQPGGKVRPGAVAAGAGAAAAKGARARPGAAATVPPPGGKGGNAFAKVGGVALPAGIQPPPQLRPPPGVQPFGSTIPIPQPSPNTGRKTGGGKQPPPQEPQAPPKRQPAKRQPPPQQAPPPEPAPPRRTRKSPPKARPEPPAASEPPPPSKPAARPTRGAKENQQKLASQAAVQSGGFPLVPPGAGPPPPGFLPPPPPPGVSWNELFPNGPPPPGLVPPFGPPPGAGPLPPGFPPGPPPFGFGPPPPGSFPPEAHPSRRHPSRRADLCLPAEGLCRLRRPLGSFLRARQASFHRHHRRARRRLASEARLAALACRLRLESARRRHSSSRDCRRSSSLRAARSADERRLKMKRKEAAACDGVFVLSGDDVSVDVKSKQRDSSEIGVLRVARGCGRSGAVKMVAKRSKRAGAKSARRTTSDRPQHANQSERHQEAGL